MTGSGAHKLVWDRPLEVVVEEVELGYSGTRVGQTDKLAANRLEGIRQLSAVAIVLGLGHPRPVAGVARQPAVVVDPLGAIRCPVKE